MSAFLGSYQEWYSAVTDDIARELKAGRAIFVVFKDQSKLERFSNRLKSTGLLVIYACVSMQLRDVDSSVYVTHTNLCGVHCDESLHRELGAQNNAVLVGLAATQARHQSNNHLVYIRAYVS